VANPVKNLVKWDTGHRAPPTVFSSNHLVENVLISPRLEVSSFRASSTFLTSSAVQMRHPQSDTPQVECSGEH
jgi:hypothetical protein